MLLLVTLGLVVASAVLLIVGFVQDTLGFIYVSMLCAGVAALALFVFARLARRRGAVLAAAEIAAGASGGSGAPGGSGRPPAEPVLEEADRLWTAEDEVLDEAPPAQPAPTRSRRTAPGGREASAPRQGDPATAQTPEEAVRQPAPTPRWADEEGGTDDIDDWGEDVVFPIADYDDLRVAEILPLLSQLDPDELRDVRDRELAGKARATVLDRIDDRLGRKGTGKTSAGGTAAAKTSAKKAAAARRAPAKKAGQAAGSERTVPAAGPGGGPDRRGAGTGEVPAPPEDASAPKKAARRSTARRAPRRSDPGSEQ